jgi:predicted RNase H-like nuclease (RuvC/YqgF family)
MQKNVEKDKQINKLQNKLEKKEKKIKYLKEENNKLKKC